MKTKALKFGRLQLWLGALTLVALSASTAQAAHFCDRAKTLSGMSYNWCVDIADKNADGTTLVYFLHGAGGNENVWSQSPAYRRVTELWAKTGRPTPVVISVSFGPLWLLTDVVRGKAAPMRAAFTHEVLPAIEAKYGLRNVKRLLIGESMGGFNASQLFAKNGEMFKKVALVCPALPTIGPFSSEAEVQAYIERHKPYIRGDWVRNILALTKGEFPTLQDWQAHDPFQIVNGLSSKSPSVFLSCTTTDEHGFFEGADLFAHQSQKRGVQTQWLPINGGGHCAQTDASTTALADFLAP